MKKLSIIIPVYNVEKYVAYCLDSVIAQNSGNIEIVVVNDGSTDGSENIIMPYVEKYDYIRYVKQKNGGLSSARNTGICIASGEYIVLLDSDDFLCEGAIAQIEKQLQANDVDVLMGRCLEYHETDNSFKNYGADFSKIKDNISAYKKYKKLNADSAQRFAGCFFITRKEFLLKNNLTFFEGIYHEDELWIPRVMVNSKNTKLMDFPFYGYRVGRTNSITTKKNIKREFDKLVIIEQLSIEEARQPKNRRAVLKDRKAALLFGMIEKFEKYKGEKEQDELLKKIKQNIFVLKKGKYWLIYIAVKCLGIKKMSSILGGKE